MARHAAHRRDLRREAACSRSGFIGNKYHDARGKGKIASGVQQHV